MEEEVAVLGALNDIRGCYRAKCRRLSREIGRLSPDALPKVEDRFLDLVVALKKFHSLLSQWEDLLPKDPAGDPKCSKCY